MKRRKLVILGLLSVVVLCLQACTVQPDLAVSGIMKERELVAIINGSVHRVGDVIDGAVVKEIKQKEVVFMHRNTTFTVPLGQATRPRRKSMVENLIEMCSGFVEKFRDIKTDVKAKSEVRQSIQRYKKVISTIEKTKERDQGMQETITIDALKNTGLDRQVTPPLPGTEELQ
jgi:hypothetical protein